MKEKKITVMNVIIQPQIEVIFRHTSNQFMNQKNMFVINVILKLHGKIIFGSIAKHS